LATRSSSFTSVFVVAVAVACTSHHDQPCPKAQPAFRIQLTASDGPLPPDTVLTVTYYGKAKTEGYSLLHGGPGNNEVCCGLASPTNGALPDVPCGIPPVMTMEASVTTPKSDAGHVRDAAVTLPERADAAAITDAAAATSDASSHAVSHDAGSVIDATRPLRDPSVADSGRAGSDAAVAHASGPEAIVCDLWTLGVATVKATGAGYARLSALLDDQSIPDQRCQYGETVVDHRLTLTHIDGGLLQ
jgi:hypothetical protein